MKSFTKRLRKFTLANWLSRYATKDFLVNK